MARRRQARWGTRLTRAGGPGPNSNHRMNRTFSTTPDDSSAAGAWLPVAFALLLAWVVVGLSYLYWRAEEREVNDRRWRDLQISADQIAYNLRDRMAAYELVLRGVKGYFDGSERIDREEFQAYVGALQLQATRPGLQGVSLVLYLPGDALPAHLADMRQRGFASYAVRPPGPRAVYTPITHIEPLEGENLKVLGFDVSTIDVAREALDRARDTGQLAVSGRLPLLQGQEKGMLPGLVMYQPVYDRSARLNDVQGRRDGLRGWVSAPFRMSDVIAGLSAEFDADVGLEIFDVDISASDSRLFGKPSAVDAEQAHMSTTRRVDFGGRHWTLRMHPLAAFEARYDTGAHALVAGVGALMGLLLGGMVWILATARERALRLARGMTSELRGTRDDLESTLNAIPDLLFELGLDGRIHHLRHSRAALLPAPAQMLVGKRMQDIVAPEAAAGCLAALQAAHETGHSAGHQYRLGSGGDERWFELSIARKENATPGQAPRFIALSRDITERKLSEARTYHLAYFDALTGLPNRRMLLDRMERSLDAARRAGQVGALLFIDLDNFKQINDARGHSLGDLLLVQVAQRLVDLLAPGDIVARLGGDEFVVLVHDLAGSMQAAGPAAMAVAETLRVALEAPYTIHQHLYSSTASIGITLFPKPDEGVEDLLREADTAMYRAKDLGRNRIRFYEAAMQADVQERLTLEQDLKNAAAEGQLAAFVQPQVNAAGAVVGGELLMRWNHPVRGSVPPARFIPVAEASGLILRMGDWMILQACETLARLQAAQRDLSISVNVSERQFRQDDFVERMRGVLASTGANPAHLILEVTESLLIENLDDTIARMTELRRLGVRFSIDDFGTGYSSLAYLKRLPLYELKIDKSFVQDAPQDPNDTAIVQSIISVARHLNLHVVAEGVETRAQADFLVASQCNGLQGYLFGRPEPLQQWLTRLLQGG